jgi:hypothetical protein
MGSLGDVLGKFLSVGLVRGLLFILAVPQFPTSCAAGSDMIDSSSV